MALVEPERYREKLNAFQERRNAVQLKAQQQFHDRTPERIRIKEEIRLRGVMAVESEARRDIRREGVDSNDGIALERIQGTNDLLGVNYLERGLKASRSVCRIQVRDEGGRTLGFGTGFLISPDLLLTNNHVLTSEAYAKRSLADFNFEDDLDCIPKDTKTYRLDPQRFFYTNEELDFTAVAVNKQATDGTPLSDFGFLQMIPESGKALLKECVSIIQHPDGSPKQVTVRENEVVDLPDSCIHYLTDTKPGSSGSPVFNDQWQVVALHHAGVKKKDNAGNVLSIHNDAPWDPNTMTEDEIAWVANEGIRISSICNEIQTKIGTIPIDRQKLASDAFSATLPEPEAAPCPDEEIVLETASPEWYENSVGYDPSFLGQDVPLPKIAEELTEDTVPLERGEGTELKYTHFSIIMSKSRRLAFFTATNIDGNNFVNVTRAKDCWYFDPRIEAKYQCGPELYKGNELDRGHLVRRMDPNWGNDAKEANRDTFHFTNCSPQHKNLNQQTWQNLEDYILKNATRYGLKVAVFTGPVFRADDMLYRGIQIPAEFWKVVAMIKDGGTISATAYLQTQKNLITELEFAYGKYRTYQVPITRIEALTKLDFGALRNHDPISDIEGAIARLISSPNDIKL
jgi:endonuclease G, mitochondrial